MSFIKQFQVHRGGYDVNTRKRMGFTAKSDRWTTSAGGRKCVLAVN
jgi:hypothetical protein